MKKYNREKFEIFCTFGFLFPENTRAWKKLCFSIELQVKTELKTFIGENEIISFGVPVLIWSSLKVALL
jgi:hypothetical protein